MNFFLTLFLSAVLGVVALEPILGSEVEASFAPEEVTAVQYADFLNQNAASDPDHLFDQKMETDPEVACIARMGTPGRWHYDLIAGRENAAINYLNSLSKARYCDWLESKAGGSCWTTDDEAGDEHIASSNLYFQMAVDGPQTVMFSNVADLTADGSDTFITSILEGIIDAIMAEEGMRFGYERTMGSSEATGGSDAMSDNDPQLMYGSQMSHGTLLGDERTESRLLENESLKTEDTCDENDDTTSMQRMNDGKIANALIPWTPPLDISKLPTEASHAHDQKGNFDGVEVLRDESPTSPMHRLSDPEGLKLSGILKASSRLKIDQPLKNVRFNAPEENEKVESQETNVAGRSNLTSLEIEKDELSGLKTKKSPEEKELNKYYRKFKGIVADLEIALDNISKDDHERVNKTAIAHAEVKLKADDLAENVHLFARKNPTIQPERVADLLANASLEAIKAQLQLDGYGKQLGKMVGDCEIAVSNISEDDSEGSNKIADIFFGASANIKSLSDVIFTEIKTNPNFLNKKTIDLFVDVLESFETSIKAVSSDCNAQQSSIRTTATPKNEIKALRDIKIIFEISSEKIGQKLLENKIKYAENVFTDISKEKAGFAVKITNHKYNVEHFSDKELTQFKENVKSLMTLLIKQRALLGELRSLVPTTNLDETRRTLIDYLSELVQGGVANIGDLSDSGGSFFHLSSDEDSIS